MSRGIFLEIFMTYFMDVCLMLLKLNQNHRHNFCPDQNLSLALCEQDFLSTRFQLENFRNC